MTDLERTYAELAREADGVILPPPTHLRHRGDRRTRVRLVTGMFAVALVVGVGTLGVGWALRAGPSGPGVVPGSTNTSFTVSSTAQSTAPSTAPSTGGLPSTPPMSSASTASVLPAAIPTSAFLQKADLRSRGEAMTQTPPVLPPLCGARHATDSLIDKRRTMAPDYREPGVAMEGTPNGFIAQTITRYRSDGATRYLDEVRAAVEACPTQQIEGHTYRQRLVSGASFGDESIIIEIRFPAMSYVDSKPLGFDRVQFVPVIRVDDLVTVLHDYAWEGDSRAPRSTMERFASRAETRLEAVM